MPATPLLRLGTAWAATVGPVSPPMWFPSLPETPPQAKDQRIVGSIPQVDASQEARKRHQVDQDRTCRPPSDLGSIPSPAHHV